MIMQLIWIKFVRNRSSSYIKCACTLHSKIEKGVRGGVVDSGVVHPPSLRKTESASARRPAINVFAFFLL